MSDLSEKFWEDLECGRIGFSCEGSDVWREYGSRKAIIEAKGLSYEEYDEEIKKLIDELGI